MALSLLKNLTKLGIAGGAIYVTLDQGIWSGTREGAVNFNRLTHTIPSQEKYVNQLPSSDDVSRSAKQTWNSGVQKMCNGLVTLPDTAANYLKQKEFKRK